MTKRIGVAAVFLVGCAVGGASSQLVLPRAGAQQTPWLATYEYKCLIGNNNDLTPQANGAGSEGWTMVGLTHISGSPSFQACFIRRRT